MAKVIWKPIVGFEGLYEVSSDGRVRSVFRYKKELKPMISNSGYERVDLFKNKKRKQFSIHRLVADAFCEKQEGKNIVNHKDECKTNNCAENLEWVDQKYNCNYGSAQKKKVVNTDYSKRKINNFNQILKCSKPISQYTKEGIFVKNWKSASECFKKTGIPISCIRRVCREERKTAGGFIFKEGMMTY